MDAIQGVGGALRIVIGHGQALGMVHELRAQPEDQTLADVGLHELVGQRLQPPEDGNGEEQADCDREEGVRGPSRRRGEHDAQEARQGPGAEHRINHDLQRHRVQQRDGACH
ncbi:MAG: hypothetical protein AUG75_09165 [Cyanobacteria bacterium 13_1_20CM_4_61_6]|nr:MAG: hypothetical protein AUG75_09165 [Cyanobacteria bacterium 13_1_20CM_4_61_6]